MSDAVEGLRKFQRVHDNIVVGLKEGGHCKEMNKSYYGRCSKLKGNLLHETEVWRRRLKGWVKIIGDYNALQH